MKQYGSAEDTKIFKCYTQWRKCITFTQKKWRSFDQIFTQKFKCYTHDSFCSAWSNKNPWDRCKILDSGKSVRVGRAPSGYEVW